MNAEPHTKVTTVRWLVTVWAASAALCLGFWRVESIMQGINPDPVFAPDSTLYLGVALLLSVSGAAFTRYRGMVKAGALFLLGYWLCFGVAAASSVLIRLGSMMVPSVR
jgi:hypothetical protein